MPNNVTSGYAQKDNNGLIIWSTFTTQYQQGTGWYLVHKVTCVCDNNCGLRMYSRDKTPLVYTEEFTFSTSGTTQITFTYETIPVKYRVYVNNVLSIDTGFQGLVSYQAQLDNYLANLGLPSEPIINNAPTSHIINVLSSDVIKVEVYSSHAPYSQYYYIVGCIGDIDCVMSPWSDWSAWMDNGDGTQSRTRTRTVIRAAEGSGTPCGQTTETDTIDSNVDCVLSDWSTWSDYVDNGDGTETRTRTRTVITPPSGTGADCGPLFETETRSRAVDCVVSSWSAWSSWTDNGNGTEGRTRTRTVITPPSSGGASCGPLSETETRDIQLCEVSAWSDWSAWYTDPLDSENICRDRTRTIVTPPSENAPACPELTETECIKGRVGPLTVNVDTTVDSIELSNLFLGNIYIDLAEAAPNPITITPVDTVFSDPEYIFRAFRVMFDTTVPESTYTVVITDNLLNTIYHAVLATSSFDQTFVLGVGIDTVNISFIPS